MQDLLILIPPRTWCCKLNRTSNLGSPTLSTAASPPVVGEFRNRREFLGFFRLIRSGACATFSLYFCTQSSPSSDLVNPPGLRSVVAEFVLIGIWWLSPPYRTADIQNN
jgi:hypothetical protein